MKKTFHLTRQKKIGSCLGAVGVLVLVAAGICLYLLNEFTSGWSSTKVTSKKVSPDGAYVATVTDWDAGGLGGGSGLKVKSVKPSSFSVRVSRLFAGSYKDSFEQIVNIQWTQNRTLSVQYLAVPGDVNHSTAWGDVHFDYKPIPVK